MTAHGMALVTGATGYVGGRLAAALERTGAPLRCLARRPEALAGRMAATTEVVKGDCLDAATLPAALKDAQTAYYLVHSMGAGDHFAALDETAARNFGEAACAAGVRRIVYLGGLGAAKEDDLSEHLRSRQQAGTSSGKAAYPSWSCARPSSSVPAACRTRWCARSWSGCR